MVLSVFAALITGIGTEVEHIPYVSCPHILTGEQLLYEFLVVICLIFLGIVTLCGLGGMPVEGFAAILGAAYGNIGVGLMELIEPGTVHRGFSAVPAEVMVIGYYIGNEQIGVIHLAHRDRRNGGKAGLIHFVAEIVEDAVVFHKILGGTADRDLVAETPDNDGGMVVVLHYKLSHLADGVLASGGHMLGDIGNLRPDNKTALIAEVIEILVVLIMGKAYSGAAHFADKIHILFVMLGKEGIADTPSVLMTAYTAERILFSVENKALVGVDFEAAAAEAGGNAVDNLAVFKKLNGGGVKIRVFASVPEVDVGNIDNCGGFGRLCGELPAAAAGRNGVAKRLTQLAVGDICIDFNLCIGTEDFGSDSNAAAAEIIKVKVALGNADEVHIAVHSAVEGKVRHLGINSVIGGVVNGDNKKVLLFHSLGEVNSPGRITAIVMSKRFAVEVNIGRGIGTAKLKIIALRYGKLAFGKALYVPARASPIIIVAVLTVDGIPAMGNIDEIPIEGEFGGQLGAALCKRPFSVEIDNSSQFSDLLFILRAFPSGRQHWPRPASYEEDTRTRERLQEEQVRLRERYWKWQKCRP